VANPALINEAFRHLQAGAGEHALQVARKAIAANPAAARARLAEALALRMLGRLDEAARSLARAAALDPNDYGVAYETGVARKQQGDAGGALAQFERARVLKPDFFVTQLDALLNLTQALKGAGRGDEADAAFVHALAANPHDFHLLRAFGQHSVSRGNYKRAATLFGEARRAGPGDEALPIYLAQVELMQGHWEAAWSAYAERSTRKHFERMLVERGTAYRVPALASLAGRDVALVGEQGYGDILFFLRWAPALARAGARLHFVGLAGLHSMLERTGLFAGCYANFDASLPATVPLMIGDLPQVVGGDPLAVESLRIAPLPERLASWRARLEAAGPRPWIGLTWRAGTPPEELAHGLYKTVPQDLLFNVARAMGGTAIALQRKPAAGEIEAAGRSLGAKLHDFSASNDQLEDALALVALLDRHIGVSNTNMHLAAAAGVTADVLVQFPPEWRWRVEGDSPWFPGFRIHRQDPGGDWTDAIAGIRKPGTDPTFPRLAGK
jgi:tetratricopeptide (TPR) repeat protein